MGRKTKNKRKNDQIEEVTRMALVIIALSVFLLTKSLTIAGVVTVISVVLMIIVVLYRRSVEKQKIKASGIGEIDRMKGSQFEKYLSVLFQNLGYQAKVTKINGDYGADLVLKKDSKVIVVQAKRYSKNVGIKAVQEVHSSQNYYKAQEAWVVTNSEYTVAPKKLAQTNNVRLIDRVQLVGLMLKVNRKKDTASRVS
ncbi:restriction endonuclease [Halobacillus salinarum]|uniref:Restriction endonuclease n=1 Tax=Halobacillus salinarum TaxID=2932257 RepID=A0ABY4EGY2_9BACI|nr:restriction endonuclease [Halobacillus salinarum]UOQ43396.1 restriction endonuclease [Halobacillus salinarum]